MPEVRGRERRIPAAEKEDRAERRHRDHAGVFGDEKHGELKAGIFGVESGDQFGFRLRKIERHTIGFSNGGDKETEEPGDLGERTNSENIPSKKSIFRAVLLADDFGEAEAVGHQEHTD